MRPVTTEFNSRLQAEVTNLVRLLTITLRDGSFYSFTDAADKITVGAITYTPLSSFTASAINLSIGNSSQQGVTLEFPLNASGLQEADLRARKLDNATCDIWLIHQDFPAYGVCKMFHGVDPTVKLTEKGRCTIEFNPDANANGGQIINVIELYSQTCRAQFGDERCTFDVEGTRVDFTVTAVHSNAVFDATALTEADNFWRFGVIEWDTGANEGVFSHVSVFEAATDRVTLSQELPQAITVGDTAHIFQGCPKTLEACAGFNNVVNFRGEPYSNDWTTYRLRGLIPTSGPGGGSSPGATL